MTAPKNRRIALHAQIGGYLRHSLIRGISSALTKHPQVELLLEDGMPFPSWETILKEQPDGLICTTLTDEDIQHIRAYKKPVINVAELLPNENTPAVFVDNYACGTIAGEHLHNSGLKHFGYIGVQIGINSEKRLDGFRSQLPEGSSYEVFKIQIDTPWPKLVEKLVDWIQPLPKPIGLYVFSDVYARAAVEAAHRLHLRIPQDIAVVGTGNYDLDTMISRPPLSSVPLNWRKVGYLATQHLLKAIEGESIPPVTHVSPRPIVIRESSNIFYAQDPAVAKALSFIKANYRRPIQVDDVAAAAGMSRRALELRFRQATDSTVHTFIHSLRLRKAQTLLLDTNDTIDAIAQASGFREARLLIAAMKKQVGLTPGAYRKQSAIQT